MPKQFFTYEQQLNKLKNEKQLTISNPAYAEEVLEKLGHYSLIGGYKNLFKHPPSGKYIYDVTFEEIVSLYYFDEELRTLFLKYILHVERHMKSMMSYYFCEKYGDNQNAYLSKNNYNLSKRNTFEIERLVKSLNKTISLPSNYAYITHHAKVYGNVPLWVAMNALTFGQVSKMYQYAPTDIRTKIAKRFGGISEKQLHQLITIVARCRNVCAHGERLYSFKIRETILNIPLHKKLNIPLKNGHYTNGKNDLFAVMLALRYLIDDEDFKKFKHNLLHIINNVLKKCPHLSKEQLLNAMGFPKNWDKVLRYKKF